MDSKELNEKISALEELEGLPNAVSEEEGTATVSPMGDINIVAPSGHHTLSSMLGGKDEKKIFYWGWYWREVDFDGRISLAYDESGQTGFCENNKWGYPMVRLSPEDSKALRDLCENAVTALSIQTVTAVNEFMSSKKPEGWKEKATKAREEVDEVMRDFRLHR